MKHILVIISVFVLATFTFTSFGCDKKTDCNATITVVDSSGIVSNATVKLFANVKSGNTNYVADVKATGTTDEGGVVKFTFKLPAIFDINATKVVGTHTYVGTGIIKLEEGKGTEKTVTIK